MAASACAVAVLLFLVFALPYLVSGGAGDRESPGQDLVSEYGRFVDIDGLAIYVEERNPESSRETIVLVHGFGGSTFSWRENVPFFAGEGYRVISLDLKGFGLSHKDFASDYSHEAQAEVVAGVLERLDVDRAYVIGHSMGTSVMLHFAHLYPEKVVALVSVAGALSLDQRSMYPAALLNFGPLRIVGEFLLSRFVSRERTRQILEGVYYGDIATAEVVDGYYDRIVRGRWASSLLAMTRDMHNNTITFPVEGMAFPTLILWGEHDTVVRRTDIDRWKDRIPAAEFHVMPEAGHLPMEESPELFNDIVLAFLESHGA